MKLKARDFPLRQAICFLCVFGVQFVSVSQQLCPVSPTPPLLSLVDFCPHVRNRRNVFVLQYRKQIRGTQGDTGVITSQSSWL
ncbi:hypothetical protein FB446DRAFT_728840 [Lentinula raphanica]|nr:hypothetical protein FB446DRAFT_728840 [Lentinula raphanica]